MNNHDNDTQVASNIVTAKGVVRCRFDLFVRWPAKAKRKLNPFTYRGDNFGITEPDKMLCSLLRNFIKNHNEWFLAELYDTPIPKNDENRVILRYKEGVMEVNRLDQYAVMLKDFPLPAFLKTKEK